MKGVATYFKLVVFHDYWQAYHELGHLNHNAADRNACFAKVINDYEHGVVEQVRQELQEFYDKHAEGGNSEIAEQANWTVGRYDNLVDALSDSDTIEEFRQWQKENGFE